MTLASATPAQRGRPVDHRKDEQILDAASHLFMAHGLQGTTMEQIAKEANVSKLTLYRRYPDKNNLFMEIIAQRCTHYIPEDMFQPTSGNAADALKRYGCALLELVTSEDGTNLSRVLTAEAHHNREICELFFSCGPQRIKNGSLQLMRLLRDSGQLACNDPAEAAEMFNALIVGCDLNKKCSMMLREAPSKEEISGYVERAVSFFLKAYSHKSS